MNSFTVIESSNSVRSLRFMLITIKSENFFFVIGLVVLEKLSTLYTSGWIVRLKNEEM